MSVFLQIFLLVDVFFAGVIAATALRHGYAHLRPHEPEVKKQHTPPQHIPLPPEVRQHLLEESEADFQRVLDKSAGKLQHDLDTTEGRLNKRLSQLGNQVVGNEMNRYQNQLDQLGKQAAINLGVAQSDIAKHQADLRAKLAEEIAAEKQQLLHQLDTKLGDAVASFLIETLQHNVDLGAQNAYLSSMLEEHKDDFKQELA